MAMPSGGRQSVVWESYSNVNETLWMSHDVLCCRLVQGCCFGERAVRFEETWPTSFRMARG